MNVVGWYLLEIFRPHVFHVFVMLVCIRWNLLDDLTPSDIDVYF